MRDALNLKFSQNLDMKATLLSTGSAKIVEDSEELFWGGVSENSKNMLGVLLMELRRRFQIEQMKAVYPVTHDNDAILVPDGTRLEIGPFNFHPFYKVSFKHFY